MYRINPNYDWEKHKQMHLVGCHGPDCLISCNQLVVPMLDHAGTRQSTDCQSFVFVTRPSHLRIRDFIRQGQLLYRKNNVHQFVTRSTNL